MGRSPRVPHNGTGGHGARRRLNVRLLGKRIGLGNGTAADVARFLRGPDRRRRELLQAVSVFREMIGGFRTLHFVGPCVTVFGSARTPEGSPYYRLGMEVGGALADAGFTVMTGGGPGVMEAANRGAKEAGGRSVGCTIRIDTEEEANAYLDTRKEFKYFFVRKVMLVKYSYGFIVMPGGYGTLDEVFETATLVQTNKIADFPIVLMGTDFWQPMLGFMEETLVAQNMIDPEDFTAITVTDDAHEAVSLIRDAAVRSHGAHFAEILRRNRLLFE